MGMEEVMLGRNGKMGKPSGGEAGKFGGGDSADAAFSHEMMMRKMGRGGWRRRHQNRQETRS
jgi:hypothetical protein